MTSLSWYKLLFMTELLIAEGLFTFRMKKRTFFWLRLFAVLAVCYAVAAFYPLAPKVSYSWWYSSLMFLVLFAVTFGGLLFLFRITPTAALFCAITAYTLQHVAYEVFTLIVNLFQLDGSLDMYGSGVMDFTTFNQGTLMSCLIYADIYIVSYGAAYLLLGKRFQREEEIRLKSLTLMYFGACILLVDIILNAVVVYIAEYNREYSLVVCVYNILCCMLVFYIQTSLVSTREMQREMSDMSEMLRQAQRQYKLQKENIDLINLKCHDLRHQMLRIAGSGKIDKEELDEINEAISIYDATVKTGNEVLDIVLTEKSLICREKGIKLTCMADCAKLNFMREGDLYVLFGNMVDNAIEAAVAVEDREKRCIGFNVSVVGSFISVTENNYFIGELRFSSDGLPETTKKDTNFHGFGMRSIDAVVNKYGGSLSVQVNGDIFRLNILIPIPKEEG